MLQSLLIKEIFNHTRHLKYLGKISGPNVAKNLYFIGLTFRRKIKSMEHSRNLKCTHNVDQGTIKITHEGNFIYIIIAIVFIKENILIKCIECLFL